MNRRMHDLRRQLSPAATTNVAGKTAGVNHFFDLKNMFFIYFVGGGWLATKAETNRPPRIGSDTAAKRE